MARIDGLDQETKNQVTLVKMALNDGQGSTTYDEALRYMFDPDKSPRKLVEDELDQIIGDYDGRE